MCSDMNLCEGLFDPTNKVDMERYFTSDTWCYLVDNSNGGGSITNTISFDTLNLRSSLVDWQSAYLMLPLTLTSSTAAYTLGSAATQLAVKSSILSLIYSVVVNTGSGQNLVNDNAVNLINNIRLSIDQSVNWFMTEASELHYALDTTNSVITAGGVYDNSGFQKRVNYLLQQCTLVGGNAAGNSLQFNAVLPLRYLHDFFNQLGLSISTHFQISFGLNFINKTAQSAYAMPPFMCGCTVAGGVLTQVTDYPIISVGNAQVPSPRIYYRAFRLSPQQAERLAQTMEAGFSKEIQFTVTDNSYGQANDFVTNNVSSQQINRLVSPSTVRPERLFVIPVGHTALVSPFLPSPWNATGHLTVCQILINNQAYYNTSLQFDYENFQEFLRTCPGYQINSQQGAQIDYSRWLGPASNANFAAAASTAPATSQSYRYYVFDISRVHDRLRSPNDSVSIQFTATLAQDTSTVTTPTPVPAVAAPAAAALVGCDMIYLCERTQCIKFSFSTGSVSYALGLNN